MTTLAAFLRVRLDEEVESARRAFSGQTDPENGWGAYRPAWQQHATITPHVGIIHEAVQADHVVRWNPARVLADIDVKRRIVAHMEAILNAAEGDDTPDHYDALGSAELTLALLAAPYADHPDYRAEWRP